MEQSYLNKIIATLKIAYPYYFKEMKKEEAMAFINLYTKKLSNYSPNVVITAIDKIITTSKFMPTIAEIIEICDKEKIKSKEIILNKMIVDNYFKCQEEIDKALNWLEKGIIPYWFKEDMKKYGYVEVNNQLENSNSKLLLGITE